MSLKHISHNESVVLICFKDATDSKMNGSKLFQLMSQLSSSFDETVDCKKGEKQIEEGDLVIFFLSLTFSLLLVIVSVVTRRKYNEIETSRLGWRTELMR